MEVSMSECPHSAATVQGKYNQFSCDTTQDQYGFIPARTTGPIRWLAWEVLNKVGQQMKKTQTQLTSEQERRRKQRRGNERRRREGTRDETRRDSISKTYWLIHLILEGLCKFIMNIIFLNEKLLLDCRKKQRYVRWKGEIRAHSCSNQTHKRKYLQ